MTTSSTQSTSSDQTILVINCGSSSLKFAVINSQSGEQYISGLAERLESDDAQISIKTAEQKDIISIKNGGHSEALDEILARLDQHQLLDNISAVGHRVVHGGEKFTSSTLITDEVIQGIKDCNALAPLHNPANLIGIEVSQQKLDNVPHIAVFDTAFHQSMPAHAYLYPVPYDLYTQYGVRRYGFHGTSHRYVTQALADQLNTSPDELCVLTAHLGNGCSAAAIANGQSVDTTMGLTPLEGLMMGTRSGDVDPSLHHFLCQQMNITIDEVNNILNKKSGLLGLSGLSNDMRTLMEARDQGNKQAELAIEVFCYRLAKQLAGLATALPRLDGLIFTGGIGENAAEIRSKVLSKLKLLGFEEDSQANANARTVAKGLITTATSTPAYVVATDEEWMIAKDTAELTN
jgi:acetate kinase